MTIKLGYLKRRNYVFLSHLFYVLEEYSHANLACVWAPHYTVCTCCSRQHLAVHGQDRGSLWGLLHLHMRQLGRRASDPWHCYRAQLVRRAHTARDEENSRQAPTFPDGWHADKHPRVLFLEERKGILKLSWLCSALSTVIISKHVMGRIRG